MNPLYLDEPDLSRAPKCPRSRSSRLGMSVRDKTLIESKLLKGATPGIPRAWSIVRSHEWRVFDE